jgi:hypothetical protein
LICDQLGLNVWHVIDSACSAQASVMPPMMRSFSISSRTHPPGQHPFRAMRDMHVERLWVSARRKAQVRTQPRQPFGQPSGRADGRGRLQDHDVTGDEDRRDRVRRCVDVIEIGRTVLAEWRRDSDDERIGCFGLSPGAQFSQRRSRAQKHVQIGLGEIGVPGVDRLDHAWVGIDADHLDTPARQRRGSRQADIAETDDAYGLDRVLHDSAPAKVNSRLGTIDRQ